MRPVGFFIALFLGLGLFFLLARLLFVIWAFAAIGGLLFFAFRGMRSFVAERRGAAEFGPYNWRREPMGLPMAQAEPLVRERYLYVERLNEGRVIPVQ